MAEEEENASRGPNKRAKGQQFRARKKFSVGDGDSGEVAPNNDAMPTVVPSAGDFMKMQPESAGPPAASRLSFAAEEDDDEDGGVAIRIQKSKESRKIEAKKKKIVTLKSLVNPDAETIISDASRNDGYFSSAQSDYSKEGLARMKAEFTVRLKDTHKTAATEDDPELKVLAGELMASLQPLQPMETRISKAKLDSESQIALKEERKSEIDAMEIDGPMEVKNGDEMDLEEGENEETIIPTVDRIQELKRRRELRRQMGFTGRDFAKAEEMMEIDERPNVLNLSTVSQPKKAKTESDEEFERNNVEEDEIDQMAMAEDHRATRIAFGDPGRDNNKKTLWDMDNASNDEENDEDDAWEREQLRKTVAAGKRGALKPSLNANEEFGARGLFGVEDPQRRTELLLGGEETEQQKRQAEQRLHEELSQEALNTEQIIKALTAELVEAKEMANHFANEQEHFKREADTARAQASESKAEMAKIEVDVKYFRELRDFVLDLLDCLAEKSIELGKLELRLETEGLELISNAKFRAHRDLQEELEEIRSLISGQPLHWTFDQENRRKDRDGEKRRRREQLALDQRNGIFENSPLEGWDSDEEADATLSALKDDIGDAARGLFDDTVEDFASLAPLKKHFETWKWLHRGAYNQAFVSLALVQIVSIYARQELLARWDWLAARPLRLSELEWFELLFEYGLKPPPELAMEAEKAQKLQEKDEDSLIIPRIAANVIFPKIKKVVTSIYDPFSNSETKRLLALFEELRIFDSVPECAIKLRECLSALRITLVGAADAHIVLFPTDWAEKNVGNVREFTLRQFWRGVKIFSNIFAWATWINPAEMAETALNGLLNAKLMPYLRTLRDNNSQGVLAIRRIAESLPKSLIGSPLLGLFQNFILNIFSKNITDKGHLLELSGVLRNLNDLEGSKALIARAGQ